MPEFTTLELDQMTVVCDAPPTQPVLAGRGRTKAVLVEQLGPSSGVLVLLLLLSIFGRGRMAGLRRGVGG